VASEFCSSCSYTTTGLSGLKQFATFVLSILVFGSAGVFLPRGVGRLARAAIWHAMAVAPDD
jgi:hypothetical protein